MITTAGPRARLILELLGVGIPDASLDYEYAEGMHRFVVLCQGLRYEFSFLERLLDTSNPGDITSALRVVVERIQARSAPRRIKFGAMAGHRAAAV